MISELDELMARLEEDPVGAPPQDIDRLIQMYRDQRVQFANGAKPKKDKGPSGDLTAVMNRIRAKATAAGAEPVKASGPVVRRRI